MKKRWISIVAVMAFAVLVAGAAYAYVDHNGWCTGNTGRSDMMGSSMGNMMGSSTGHMTARHNVDDQSYKCPGWEPGNQDTGDHDPGSK